MLPPSSVVDPVFRWLVLTTGSEQAAEKLFWRGFRSAEARLVSTRDEERQRDLLAVACRQYLDAWQPEPGAERSTDQPAIVRFLPELPAGERALLGWFAVSLAAGGFFHNPFGEKPSDTAALLASARDRLAGLAGGVSAPGAAPTGAELDLQWVPFRDSAAARKAFPQAWEEMDSDETLRSWFRKRALFDHELEAACGGLPVRGPSGAGEAEALPALAAAGKHRWVGGASVVGAVLLLGVVLGLVFLKRANTVEFAPNIVRLVKASYSGGGPAYMTAEGGVGALADLLFLRIESGQGNLDPGVVEERVNGYRFIEGDEQLVADIELGEGQTRLLLFSADGWGIESEKARERWELVDTLDMACGLRIRGDLGHLIVRPGSRQEVAEVIARLQRE